MYSKYQNTPKRLKISKYIICQITRRRFLGPMALFFTKFDHLNYFLNDILMLTNSEIGEHSSFFSVSDEIVFIN